MRRKDNENRKRREILMRLKNGGGRGGEGAGRRSSRSGEEN